jgi:hypothetical protein
MKTFNPLRLVKLIHFACLWALSPTLEGVDALINIQAFFKWVCFSFHVFFTPSL